MVRVKSADQRLELNRQIAHKENQLDELNQEKQRYTRQIENYQDEMNRLYREEEEFYFNLERSGRSLGWSASAWPEVRRAILGFSRSQSEQMEQDFRNEVIQLQEEIENTQKERDALPWD
jgi:peptidoglycan hydrolase CwlO-like protein